jgi:hypothetical protein
VVAFCIDNMSDQQPIGVPRSRHEGRLARVGLMGLESPSPSKEMFDATHLKALYHTSSLHHCEGTQENSS